jgi:hypothetical protein
MHDAQYPAGRALQSGAGFKAVKSDAKGKSQFAFRVLQGTTLAVPERAGQI